MEQRKYIAIDLKSFYASVECVERGLDPLDANLVVADSSRTSKTICLAVSPSLKSYGIPGRARLFEVEQKIREVNQKRKVQATGREFSGSSHFASELSQDKNLELSMIIAPPRMALYIDYSSRIYNIYLKYVAAEDIHVYSIDEVFIDVTDYLAHYKMTAKELAVHMVQDIYVAMGITATAGIGTNLYLAKVAMDIVAKHMPADENGARVAEIDEFSYRRLLWNHRPITDFWRVGPGYAKRLAGQGIYTMGQIAKCSLGAPGEYYNEDLLYRLLGINAELLIDHAWGYEPCTIEEIKEYRPEVNCLSSGQVLSCAYDFEKGEIIIREMADALALDMVDKCVVADQLVLTVSYDIDNLGAGKKYSGPVVTDRYGRKMPEHAHGTISLEGFTSSSQCLISKATALYREIVNPDLLIRRVNITVNHVIPESQNRDKEVYEQMSLFVDYEKAEQEKKEQNAEKERERKMQEAMLAIKKKYGKNAILKGTNLKEGATAISRNAQIGGHKA
ncbi:MAG: DNA methylase [Lachnospiraceae bacterium]